MTTRKRSAGCIMGWVALSLIAASATVVEGHLESAQYNQHGQGDTDYDFIQRELQLTTISEDSLPITTRIQKSAYPQRVRIAPFDLLLAPTPIQLQRADEDALLAELQEIIVLFMKVQFGEQTTSVTRMETATTLDYVLFSDIEENSWTLGKKDPSTPPRTVLRFNGGVASFQGENTPTEGEVNEWVEAAVDGLFGPALEDTPYHYIELTQYMKILDFDTVVKPTDIVVNLPSYDARPVQGVAQQSQTEFPGGTTADYDTSLYYILATVLCVIVVVAVILSLWIRHNNRAVRVLCLSDKDKEEVVDFSDEGGSISIEHNTDYPQKKDTYENYDDEDEDYDDFSLKKDSLINVDNDMKDQISLATQCAVEEASLASGSTFPTLSALSFRSPNPFSTKSVMSQESFQKERKTYLSKDMMYSPWSQAPNLDSMHGKRKDESVLRPSYFSAEKERDFLTQKGLPTKKNSDRKCCSNSGGDNKDSTAFQFEAAHGDGEDGAGGLYMIPPSRSTQVKSNCNDKVSSGQRRGPSDLV